MHVHILYMLICVSISGHTLTQTHTHTSIRLCYKVYLIAARAHTRSHATPINAARSIFAIAASVGSGVLSCVCFCLFVCVVCVVCVYIYTYTYMYTCYICIEIHS